MSSAIIIFKTVYPDKVVSCIHMLSPPWEYVQQVDRTWREFMVYVALETRGDATIWRVLRIMPVEVLDVEFPSRDAAVVYAVTLMGGV